MAINTAIDSTCTATMLQKQHAHNHCEFIDHVRMHGITMAMLILYIAPCPYKVYSDLIELVTTGNIYNHKIVYCGVLTYTVNLEWIKCPF